MGHEQMYVIHVPNSCLVQNLKNGPVYRIQILSPQSNNTISGPPHEISNFNLFIVLKRAGLGNRHKNL